jgi:hypothetical protein
MELFICKAGNCAEFEAAVLSYRGKNRAKYEAGVVKKYFGTLLKIESSINNPKLKLYRKINK